MVDLQVMEVMGGHDLHGEILATKRIKGVGCHFQAFQLCKIRFRAQIIRFVDLKAMEVMVGHDLHG